MAMFNGKLSSYQRVPLMIKKYQQDGLKVKNIKLVRYSNDLLLQIHIRSVLSSKKRVKQIRECPWNVHFEYPHMEVSIVFHSHGATPKIIH